jgi:hypothetical protein
MTLSPASVPASQPTSLSTPFLRQQRLVAGPTEHGELARLVADGGV